MTPKINICRINRGIGDRVMSWPRYPFSFLSTIEINRGIYNNDYIDLFELVFKLFQTDCNCKLRRSLNKIILQERNSYKNWITQYFEIVRRSRRKYSWKISRIAIHFFDECYVTWKCYITKKGETNNTDLKYFSFLHATRDSTQIIKLLYDFKIIRTGNTLYDRILKWKYYYSRMKWRKEFDGTKAVK